MANNNKDKNEITFKASYWNNEQTGTETIIHISGKTANNQSVYVLVKNYKPSVYLELPLFKGNKKIAWDKKLCNHVYEFIKSRMCKFGPEYLPAKDPFLTKRDKLYHKTSTYLMLVSFNTEEATKKFANVFNFARTGLEIPSVGSFPQGAFKVHEHNLDLIVKFAAIRNVQLSGWITVTKDNLLRPGGDDDDDDYLKEEFSSADINVCTNWTNVRPRKMEGNVYIPPRYISFDLECYSKNHNSKQPNPDIPENKVVQISIVEGTLFAPETRVRKILTLGHPKKIINAEEIRKHTCEADLLLDFVKVVQEFDPDIYLGYNILKFDWGYLIKRSVFCDVYMEFANISRIFGKRANLMSDGWNSNAYGEQKFTYFDCHGRVNVDVLLEVERNYKLSTYKLDAVAEQFLNKRKDDVSVRSIFMLWQVTNEILPLVIDKDEKRIKPTIKDMLKYHKRIKEIFIAYQCSGPIRAYRAKLLATNCNTFTDTLIQAMEIMGEYCVQDSVLAVDLAEKLNLWTTMESMSNVTNVPMSYLHTKGQQIKVVAQVYRESLKNNIFIPFMKGNGTIEKFQGATVIEANPGYYELVPQLDFNSLYPSMIIAFNICYTTFLQPGDKTPDSECHVLWVRSHVGCAHDPQKRKKNTGDIRCSENKYRFRKVTYKITKHEDGKLQIDRINEGLVPRMERNLLGERKIVKKSMVKADAKIQMHEGSLTNEELDNYKKWGFEIIEPGSLSEHELAMAKVDYGTFNADQLAFKVSANSIYGILGQSKGMIPLIAAAASVTAMGREMLEMAIARLRKEYDCFVLVYGDTDSCMIQFKGKNLAETFKLAKEGMNIVNHHLKCYLCGVGEDYMVGDVPLAKMKSTDAKFMELSYKDQCIVLDYEMSPINLDFEKLNDKYFLLTKKRYIAEITNEEGKIIDKVRKGVKSARRDTCKYFCITYDHILNLVMQKLEKQEIIDYVCDRISLLFTRKGHTEIPDAHFVVSMGIKSLVSYAKTKKVEKANGEFDKILIDAAGDIIDDVIGPLDPRLVYSNIPQVILGLKMLHRGDELPPNTRLEYLYLETKNKVEHQGEKAEDYTYFRENKRIENLRPDLLHYIEKSLMKPITEVINVKFSHEIIPHIEMTDKLRNYMDKLSDLHRYRVKNLKSTHNKERSLLICENPITLVIGWDVWKKERISKNVMDIHDRLADDKEFKHYSFKNQDVQIEYMLNDIIRNKDEINAIDGNDYDGLKDFCHLWKSMQVIDKFYKKHGLTKRKWKKPTYTKEQIKIGASAIFIKQFKDESGNIANINDVCKIIDRKDIGGPLVNSDGAKIAKSKQTKESFYDLLIKDVLIVKKVPRHYITTFTYKDDCVIKQLFKYRTNYKCVVDQLSELFANYYLQLH